MTWLACAHCYCYFPLEVSQRGYGIQKLYIMIMIMIIILYSAQSTTFLFEVRAFINIWLLLSSQCGTASVCPLPSGERPRDEQFQPSPQRRVARDSQVTDVALGVSRQSEARDRNCLRQSEARDRNSLRLGSRSTSSPIHGGLLASNAYHCTYVHIIVITYFWLTRLTA